MNLQLSTLLNQMEMFSSLKPGNITLITFCIPIRFPYKRYFVFDKQQGRKGYFLTAYYDPASLEVSFALSFEHDNIYRSSNFDANSFSFLCLADWLHSLNIVTNDY